MSDYKHYVRDEKFLTSYNEYQQRYAEQTAERDKAMIDLVRVNSVAGSAVLDIGCSTGNLLKHMARLLPDRRLYGGELAESSLVEACANLKDTSVRLSRMDMLAIPGRWDYDVIVANAVTYLFDWPTYERALRSVVDALMPGGTYISLEWCHPFSDQDIAIIETTEGHPDGLPIHARSYRRVCEALVGGAGFSNATFIPFDLPFDIERGDPAGTPTTYTEKTADGRRLQFRGALYQPWCFVVATKA